MSFASMDALVAALAAGQAWRSDWMLSNPYVSVAGQWRDLSQASGMTTPNAWGELLKNGAFTGSANLWTLGTGWTYSANTAVHAAASSLSSLSQTPWKALVAGRTYRVTFTASGVSGSGSFRVRVGYVATAGLGTERSTNATFTEDIVAGAGTLIEINCDAARGVTIDNVSVQPVLEFCAYNDQAVGALYHGGNVSPLTKHVVNATAWSPTATGVPSVLMLVDMLGCYPNLDMNVATAQALANNETLPRYTTGAGVRAFVAATVATGATAHGLESVDYTNAAAAAGRNLPYQVACTISASPGNIIHSGVAATQCAPFLPLQDGDTGIRSVQSFKLSAATGTAGSRAALVLCRPLLYLPLVAASIAMERDLVNMWPSLPRVYDGAYLAWIAFTGAAFVAAGAMYGNLDVAWG